MVRNFGRWACGVAGGAMLALGAVGCSPCTAKVEAGGNYRYFVYDPLMPDKNVSLNKALESFSSQGFVVDRMTKDTPELGKTMIIFKLEQPPAPAVK